MSRTKQIKAKNFEEYTNRKLKIKAEIEKGASKFIDYPKELDAIRYQVLKIDFDKVSWKRETNPKNYCDLGEQCYKLFKKTLFPEDENDGNEGAGSGVGDDAASGSGNENETTNASLGGKKNKRKKKTKRNKSDMIEKLQVKVKLQQN